MTLQHAVASTTATDVISAQSSPQEIVIAVAESARETLGMELAVVADTSAGDSICRVVLGDGPGFGAFTGASLALDDATRAGFSRTRGPGGQLGSHVRVPVLGRDGAQIGTLFCASRAPKPQLGERHLRLMRVFACLIAEQVLRAPERAEDHRPAGCRLALAAPIAAGGSRSATAAALARLRGELARGDILGARAAATDAAELTDDPPLRPFVLALSGFALYWSDELDRSRHVHEEAIAATRGRRELGQVRAAALSYMARIALAQQRVAVACGHVEDAIEASRHIGVNPHVRIAAGATALAEGMPERAAAELEHGLRQARRREEPVLVGEALSLLARCAAAQGERAQAIAWIREASAVAGRCWAPAALGRLVADTEHSLRIDALATAPLPGEPLSPRERQVLGMLRGTLSLPMIADELFVSHNTVKTHCKAIYRKLGVSSRAEAVARARAR